MSTQNEAEYLISPRFHSHLILQDLCELNFSSLQTFSHENKSCHLQHTISSQYEFCTHMPVFWASVTKLQRYPFNGLVITWVSAHESFYPCEFILPNSAGVKFGDFGKKSYYFTWPLRCKPSLVVDQVPVTCEFKL